MGLMDRFCRKNAKRLYRSPRRPLHHNPYPSKYAAPAKDLLLEHGTTKTTTTTAIVPATTSITEGQQHQQQQQLLELGAGVFTMMQCETELLLQQKNPCTKYEIALAFQKSKDIQDAIRNDTLLEGLTSTAASATTNRSPNDVFSQICASVQRQSSSLITTLSSWSDVQIWLSTDLSIQPRSTETLHESNTKSLESFRILLERNTTRKYHTIIRGFHQRQQQKQRTASLQSHQQQREDEQSFHTVAYHQSEGNELKELAKQEEEAYQDAVQKVQDEALRTMDDIDERIRAQEREEEAQRIASELIRPLTDKEKDIVHKAIYGMGRGDAIMAREVETGDVVVRDSLRRLAPGQWLNDEIIHYFMVMLSKRDEALTKQTNDGGAVPPRKRSHFFKSFFMTKLLNEGHAKLDGTYEYRNVKRWSKKVPGKDIFQLDKIIFPINVGSAHWICGVVFMTEKRIQMYDSMGASGTMYLHHLFQYVQDEHLDKKKQPLPDLDQWELVGTTKDTPRQMNGFDCGVFTCMFADFLSKDCPLVFSQEHITQCRERIALSIMNGSALM